MQSSHNRKYDGSKLHCDWTKKNPHKLYPYPLSVVLVAFSLEATIFIGSQDGSCGCVTATKQPMGSLHRVFCATHVHAYRKACTVQHMRSYMCKSFNRHYSTGVDMALACLCSTTIRMDGDSLVVQETERQQPARKRCLLSWLQEVGGAMDEGGQPCN